MTLAAEKPVWTPGDEELEHSRIAQLMREVGVDDYQQLWRWSVDDLDRFWRTVWEMFDIQSDGRIGEVLADPSMPGTRWFPGVRLSFPEHAFRDRAPEAVAIYAYSEAGEPRQWTWGDLAAETARIRSGLKKLGVGRGDRVAGYLPNVPETIAAFFATASLGAIWACCSPDFGSKTVIDRLAQIEPKVLLYVDRYRFSGKEFDRSDAVATLIGGLPTLEATVRLDLEDPDRTDWALAFPATDEPLTFERVPFDHPLWIVFSSGTTGLPKAIVHGHGGILLEQFKMWPLHHDVDENDVMFWYSSTGWVMWNLVVGALTTGAPVVVYDGSPMYPDPGRLWDIVEQTGTTVFGSGAGFLHTCMKQELDPAATRDLSRLRIISSSGSPLAPEAYGWVRDRFGPAVALSSSSGGTDICGAFVGGTPVTPVYPGELPARVLGVAVEAWNDAGDPVIDEVGELVVTQPMPSMPVRFWNDPDDSRYRESYFEMFPGVWRHGDWLRLTPRGSAVIYGRSDSTINRGGVRMGTAEIYGAVRSIPEITDALVVDVPAADGIGTGNIYLFVVLTDGAVLDDELEAVIRQRIRQDCSPRHVPDRVIPVPAVPYTLSGKLLEVPVKRLLMGWSADQVASRDALADPDAFDWFVDYAAGQRGSPAR